MRIAVVSDLHVHHETDMVSAESWLTCNSPRDPWSNHPIASLNRLVSSDGLRADAIVCPGDFTNRASPRGMETAFAFLDELTIKLGGAPTITTPGNHDVLTFDIPGADTLAALRPYIPRIPIPEATASAALWRDHFVVIDVGDTSFLILNTIGKATDRASARRGVFDESLRDAVAAYLGARALRRIKVAVLHHHPINHSIPGFDDSDVLQRGDELVRMLTDHSFALIVHGHKHHARLSYGQSGSDGPAILAAGSLSWIPKGSLITITKNLFHLIELDVGGIAGVPFAGQIRTWQFVHGDGWVPSSRNSTKFPHVAGFGCRFAPAAVAADIAGRVRGTTRWSDLVNQIQALDYIAPDDQARVFQRLESAHQIDVSFDERGDPYVLTAFAN